MRTLLAFTFLLQIQRTVPLITSSGQVVNVNNVPYYVPPTSVTRIHAGFAKGLSSAGELIPVTVVDGGSAGISQAVAKYASDDVWNEGFLEGR